MKSGQKKLLIILAVFLLPIVLGTLLFFTIDKLGLNRGSTNYGTLVQPALPAVMGDLMQGSEIASKEATLVKKWTLVYIEPKECDQVCLDKLVLMNKIRLLTNEKMRRVRTLFVTNKGTADIIDNTPFKNMVITHVDQNDSAFIQQFPKREIKPIYLIDPYGNIMMYYGDKDLNAKKVIKDLNRLLKYSKLG